MWLQLQWHKRPSYVNEKLLWFQTLCFLSHVPGTGCPAADTGESWRASVHSKSMRGPEREHLCWGGKWTALIRKTPKVFYRFRESFVCVFISLMKIQMSNIFNFTLWCLKYSCFSPLFFVYSLTSPSSPIRSPCLTPIPSFLSFLHLSSPNSSLVYLCVLPCPRPAPIGYHLTWQCVLAPYSGKGMLLSLPLYTISLSWNSYTPCSLCMTI